MWQGTAPSRPSTIADLAWRPAAWGFPAERLLASLAGAASTGGPLRVPPLYAVEVQPSITFTFGGLRIDRQGPALDPTGAAIGNLYVVGADAGGVQDVGYIGGLVLVATLGPVVAAAALNARARPRPS